MNVTWADVVRTKAPKAATSETMKNGLLGNKKFVSKIILSKQSRYKDYQGLIDFVLSYYQFTSTIATW
jgi:hypothetical protein